MDFILGSPLHVLEPVSDKRSQALSDEPGHHRERGHPSASHPASGPARRRGPAGVLYSQPVMKASSTASESLS